MAEVDRRRRGRRGIDRLWVQRIFLWEAQEPHLSHQAVFERLQAAGFELKRNDYPSLRTLPAIRKRFYDELTAEAQREYTLVRWPESFISGALPWEASASTLELLRLYLAEGEDHRPTVRAAQWFWRVSLSMPGAASSDHTAIAWVLFANELIGGEPPADHLRRLELLARYPHSWWSVGGQTEETRERIIRDLMTEVWVRMLDTSVEQHIKRWMAAGIPETDRQIEGLIKAVMTFAPYPGFWTAMAEQMGERVRQRKERGQ